MFLKKFLFTCLIVICAVGAHAQDFSNKGTEFWLSYSYHVGMSTGNANQFPVMTLYITSDVATSFTVEIFGGATIQTGNIAAGQVTTVNIPSTYFINNEGLFTNKAIRVSAAKPIVVYSYITRAAVSSATLCLPTSVLGREYYTSNFTQISNEPNSNSFFTIIAVEDNTTVKITPAGKTKDGKPAGVPFTVNLNKGEIYQVLGAVNSFINGIENGVDLTGSKIESIASGTGGCKRIAVYSGSGKILIKDNTNCGSNTSDNLYQQLYPIVTWGKKYLTVPSYNRTKNIYRILINDPSTNVYLNGQIIPSISFINGRYYQFSNTIPNSIQADQPVSVVQYFTTQGCDGNPTPYDPDMIVLNPVEQNIDKVTLVSSNLAAPVVNPQTGVSTPHQHHIHVIMKNGGTGISSFKLDGNTVAPSRWVNHPNEPSYSYLYLNNINEGYHRIESDSGFNAIAYGYANAESYGYSAGANVKDLYQFASIKNEFATVDFSTACRNSPFYFQMTFPYQPLQIKWIFGATLNTLGINDVTVNNPVYDSTWIVNGKQLYRYTLPSSYTIPSVGKYPIKVMAENSTGEGCSGMQEIDYELQVFERPVADFDFNFNGCLSDQVKFVDKSNGNGRQPYKWFWNFGDGNQSTTQNPSHLYTNAGSYNVSFSMITDIGCISDPTTKTVSLAKSPVANFTFSNPLCVNKSVNFIDASTSEDSPIVKWYWNFGDGSPEVVANTNANQIHTYSSTGNYNVTLIVESATGCKSVGFTRQVTISPNPVPDFTFGNACLPNGLMQFTNTSTIPGGTALTYNWNFGDGNTSTATSPLHTYNTVGPFDVKLTVTSDAGCTENKIATVNTVFAQPQANFTAPAEVCLGSTATFNDASTAPNSTVASWEWNFGDGATSTQKNPTHNYLSAGTYTVTLSVRSAIGCPSTVASKSITVNPLPVANFNTSAPTCVTKGITFTDASVANAGNIIEWGWDMGDGNTFTKTTNNPFIHTYNTTGTYNVKLLVKTENGCVSTLFSKQVVVNPLPVPGFIMPGNCLADPFTEFTDTSKIANGTESQFTYLWNFGDQNANAGNPNTSTEKNPKHKYTATGNYNVTLTVTSGSGCVASTTQVFTINGSQPQSTFTIQGGTNQCSNKTVTVQNNSTVDVGKLVKIEILWDANGDASNKMVINNPPAGGLYTYTYPEFFTPTTKDYAVKVIAYSGENCLSTTSQTLQMKATPQVAFSPVSPVCADVLPFQITQATITNNLPGTGVFSGTGVSPSGSFDPKAAGAGTHIIRYTFTGSNGCTNFKEQTIKVFPVPAVNAGPDRFMLEGGSTILLGSGGSANVSYSWSPPTALNNPAIAQPVATPSNDITYALTVTSENGCRATDNVFVKVLVGPVVPNVFTPNGDGKNDKWVIQYLDTYPGATIQIFNRYGQKVFESKGKNEWDGTVNGKPVSAGTYYYIIDPKNGKKPMSGFVDVLR